MKERKKKGSSAGRKEGRKLSLKPPKVERRSGGLCRAVKTVTSGRRGSEAKAGSRTKTGRETMTGRRGRNTGKNRDRERGDRKGEVMRETHIQERGSDRQRGEKRNAETDRSWREGKDR